MSTILDILSYWLKWANFDENQRTFSMINNSYDLHQITILAKECLEKYDKTGALSTLLIKEKFNSVLKSTRVKLWDVVSDIDKFESDMNMYKLLNSDVVGQAEKELCGALSKIYSSITGVGLLDGDKEFAIASEIENCLRDIDRLRIDIYSKNGQPIRLDKYNKNIFVFNTLSEAILTMGKAKDGVYLCYIDILQSADSYFALFVKSGLNLISFNDRINEKYPGQHEVLNHRNGRWSLDKRDSIFPYDAILEYSNRCSKGVAMQYNLKSNEDRTISFADFKDTVNFSNLALTLLLLNMRYNNKVIDGELITTSGFKGDNIKVLEAKSDKLKNELMIVGDTQLVLKDKLRIDVDFTEEDVMNSFTKNDKVEAILKYADGFKLEKSGIFDENEFKQLVDGELHSDIRTVHPEYVGSIGRIRNGAMYTARKQLADYIERKLNEECKQPGYSKKIKDEYMGILRSKLDILYVKAAMAWLKLSDTQKNQDNLKEGVYTTLDGVGIHIRNSNYSYCSVQSTLNTYVRETNRFIDNLSDDKCNYFFNFKISSMKQLREFLDIEDRIDILEIIDEGYYGNSLLDMVDPLLTLRNPIMRDFNFTFSLGMSKRSLNKLLNIVNKA